MIDINLLPPKNLLTRKEQELRQKLLVAVVISSALCLIVVGTLFLTDVWVAKRVENLSHQKQQLATSYSSLKETAMEIRVLQGKIKGIKKIKETRLDFATEITALNVFFGGVTVIKSLDLTPPNTVRLVASSSDTKSLNLFFDRVASGGGEIPLKNVVISGLGLSGSGYAYSLGGTYVP